MGEPLKPFITGVPVETLGLPKDNEIRIIDVEWSNISNELLIDPSSQRILISSITFLQEGTGYVYLIKGTQSTDPVLYEAVGDGATIQQSFPNGLIFERGQKILLYHEGNGQKSKVYVVYTFID